MNGKHGYIGRRNLKIQITPELLLKAHKGAFPIE